MPEQTPLPGDALARAIARARAEDLPLPERDRGSLDPQTIAEFLAYDVGFREEPATGFDLPPEAQP